MWVYKLDSCSVEYKYVDLQKWIIIKDKETRLCQMHAVIAGSFVKNQTCTILLPYNLQMTGEIFSGPPYCVQVSIDSTELISYRIFNPYPDSISVSFSPDYDYLARFYISIYGVLE